ncbi:MAG: hypothetical protein MR636_03515 [Clostridiales bacterium]|nr:hypothetical protein [Clostridiales bacterium]
MNRKLISKALGGIDDHFIAESMVYREANPRRSPERNRKMGKYENRNAGHSHRRLFALVLAACLVFSLAITAYAANLFGIREMFRTPYRELPEAVEPYIQQHTEAAESYIPQNTEATREENWSARVTESLCDGTKILVTVTISGGDQYIVAPTDAMPSDTIGLIGLSGDQTLESYAQSQGKNLLLVGATLRRSEGLGIFVESQKFENSSPSEMHILVEADRTSSDPAEEAVCQVYALEAGSEAVERLELPFTLEEAPKEEESILVPVTPDAIPGVTVGEATVTETPLGISVRWMETITDQDAHYDIKKVEFDELTDYDGGGLVQADDGNWYFQISMGKGEVTDTLTAHFYDWENQPIGDIVFKKK